MYILHQRSISTPWSTEVKITPTIKFSNAFLIIEYCHTFGRLRLSVLDPTSGWEHKWRCRIWSRPYCSAKKYQRKWKFRWRKKRAKCVRFASTSRTRFAPDRSSTAGVELLQHRDEAWIRCLTIAFGSSLSNCFGAPGCHPSGWCDS